MNKKRILITGKGSYVGTSFMKWVEQWPEQYDVEEISVRGEEWKLHDFSVYDVVLHVAGIAHVSTDPSMESQYYKINRDLTIEVANKAKNENVKQFVFMSSMIIYGPDGKIGVDKMISQHTVPNPIDFYGKSKLEADNAIQELNSPQFKAVSVRIPMVYGPSCKGNFPRLKLLAGKLPVFPDIRNQRSMIFVSNLCEFLRIIIEKELAGVFFPQNKEYVCTTEIIKIMASTLNKKVRLVKVFNPILKIMSSKINFVNKIFGNKTYDQALIPPFDYCIVEFEESIKISM
ncbi:NAD-dependent epimerase/dehydratase family protein [Paenibacillus sp. LMG 31459]|uniref:NAD-dependent epimerase/dehydratase family protein n=1 Tax=Paenibacillus phytohabitans TaxID=2654978 RepID=A0ABX1YRM1_9BACL|nr:NAD-dependent epimerase/dehydratase family protein [Paenibacillus phytohabitans]NOU82463.1 NAD-dependent epimerase/dehydratase family protein [Paenibacillus phytohabitans]